MSKAIKLYKGGITELREAAVRADGVVFTRGQYRSAYGYAWTQWRASGATVDVSALPAQIECGFATLSSRSGMGGEHDASRLRLP